MEDVATEEEDLEREEIDIENLPIVTTQEELLEAGLDITVNLNLQGIATPTPAEKRYTFLVGSMIISCTRNKNTEISPVNAAGNL